MSDITPVEVSIGLGEQPFDSTIMKTVDQHQVELKAAIEAARSALQKVYDVVNVELANLPFMVGSGALGNTRSHLTYLKNETALRLEQVAHPF